MCIRSQLCQIDGCRGNHHRLLHEVLPVTESTSPAAREGVTSPDREHSPTPPALTGHNPRTSEAYSLRTIPVWVKVKRKKIKVNAILDDASNESFLNEEVAGALKQSYQTVKVHVLNNSVETSQAKPLIVTIESVNGRLTKKIEVKTCPLSVTGSYQVENWRASKVRWPHLAHLVQRRMDRWTC